MTPITFHSGKTPARYDKNTLRYTEYRNALTPIQIPTVFGHGNSFTNWGMLGNDDYGDCVWAGSAHETMLINNLAAGGAVGDQVVPFNPTCVLSDYSAVTGFVIGQPNTDQGTDVQTALNYRVNTGILDANGNRHKIGAFVSLEPGNLQHIIEAMWIFEAVGIGINFPESADDQFNAGQVWSVVKGAKIVGGHYIPLVGVPASGNLACITWAQRQIMTDAFFSTYCDEAYAYVTMEAIQKNKQTNWGGLDWAQLEADLNQLP